MRAVIIGNSGSGKTWLAKRLGQQSGTPVHHLDEFFWLPGGFNQKRPAYEVACRTDAALHEPDCIVEGVFGDLAAPFLPDADVLFWLDLPWPDCKKRLKARGSESKSHMARAQSDQGLSDLMHWAENYYCRTGDCSRSGHLELYSAFKGMRYRLCSQQQVLEYLNAD